MNKKLRRVISALLALCLLACMIIPAASAMPQESADGSIKRISVVINAPCKIQRQLRRRAQILRHLHEVEGELLPQGARRGT